MILFLMIYLGSMLDNLIYYKEIIGYYSGEFID
jgi:hypothetical protein